MRFLVFFAAFFAVFFAAFFLAAMVIPPAERSYFLDERFLLAFFAVLPAAFFVVLVFFLAAIRISSCRGDLHDVYGHLR